MTYYRFSTASYGRLALAAFFTLTLLTVLAQPSNSSVTGPVLSSASELADNIGLGWNLNKGKGISRIIRVIPDNLQNKGYWWTQYDLDASQHQPQAEDAMEVHMIPQTGSAHPKRVQKPTKNLH